MVHEYTKLPDANTDGLVQDCSISSTLAVEILQSYTNPSIYDSETNSYQMFPRTHQGAMLLFQQVFHRIVFVT